MTTDAATPETAVDGSAVDGGADGTVTEVAVTGDWFDGLMADPLIAISIVLGFLVVVVALMVSRPYVPAIVGKVIRIVAGALAIVVVVFAVLFTRSNQQEVVISLYPTPYEVSQVPIWFIVWSMFLTGFLIGVLVTWANGARRRRMARKEHKQLVRLEREVEQRREEEDPLAIASGPGPALLTRAN